MKPVPEVLDKMADVILAYRPKSKVKKIDALRGGWHAEPKGHAPRAA